MNRDNITGKSILLIIEPFYGYGQIMKNELLKIGAKYVYLKTATFIKGSFRDGFSIRTVKEFLNNPCHRSQWTQELIAEIDGIHFDTLFVVENMPFKRDFLRHISEQNPCIRKILFLWDTFKTQQPYYFDYLPLFDTVYSFDRDDAAKYNLRYFPDFYIDVPTIPMDECKYDITFVGAMNMNTTLFRGNLLMKIKSFAIKHHLNYYFYLKYYKLKTPNNFIKKIWSKLRYKKYWKTIASLKHTDLIYSDAIAIQDYNKIMATSKVIVDLNHQKRQGLTINAITALAMGKKLITTNERIKDELFYDPSTILVIDDENPVLSIDFFNKAHVALNLQYLRLDNWLKHIVNEEE